MLLQPRPSTPHQPPSPPGPAAHLFGVALFVGLAALDGLQLGVHVEQQGRLALNVLGFLRHCGLSQSLRHGRGGGRLRGRGMAVEMAVEMVVGEVAGAHGQGGWEGAARVLAARGLFTARGEACCSRDPARWTSPNCVQRGSGSRSPEARRCPLLAYPGPASLPAVSCTAEPSLNPASRCCRVVSYLREALADVTENETTRYRHIVCHALCDDILPGVSEEGLPGAASTRARGRARALLVRSPYYECNVWGYAVLPGVDISCRAHSHAGRRIKATFTKHVKLAFTSQT
eukprot:scaffold74933_cov54-Phaeocystis_antarctica.AAC.4